MFTDLHKQMVDAYAAVFAAEKALLKAEKGNVRARKEYVEAVKQFLGVEEHFRPYAGMSIYNHIDCAFEVGTKEGENIEKKIYQPETYVNGAECEAIMFLGQTDEAVREKYFGSGQGMMVLRQHQDISIYLARPAEEYQAGNSLAEELEMPAEICLHDWVGGDNHGKMSLAWQRSHEVSIDELCAHENQEDPDKSLFSRFYNGLQRATTLAIRGHKAEKERLDKLKGKHTESKKKLKESVALLEQVGKQDAA